MKKKVYFLAFIAAAVLSSCQKEDPIYFIEDCKCSIESKTFTVQRTDWYYTEIDNNNYFYVVLDVPMLNQNIFENGLISLYRTYDFGSNQATQIELPYIRHFERNIGGDNWEFYTETLDYEISHKQIRIYYTLSNFDYEIDESLVPDSMTFRLVVMENKKDK